MGPNPVASPASSFPVVTGDSPPLCDLASATKDATLEPCVLEEELDIGILKDYVSAPQQDLLYLELVEGLLDRFRKAINLDFSMKVVLEKVRTTTRMLVPTGLSLKRWKTSVLSMLHAWGRKEQFVTTSVGSRQQQVSSLQASISASLERQSDYNEKIKGLQIKITEMSSQISVIKCQCDVLEMELKQSLEALDSCTTHLGCLEDSLSCEVQAMTREVSENTLAKETLVRLESELKILTGENLEAYLEACKSSLANLQL